MPRTRFGAGTFDAMPATGSTPMPPSNRTRESSAITPNGARVRPRTNNNLFTVTSK